MVGGIKGLETKHSCRFAKGGDEKDAGTSELLLHSRVDPQGGVQKRGFAAITGS